MKLLIVEDDEKIALYLQTGLSEAGYSVEFACDGIQGLQRVLADRFDAVILDIMLPRLDGLGLLARMRQSNVATPVLILSAKQSVDDRVRGLQCGGDDYLTKPFAFSELLARIQSLIRRASGTPENTRLVVGDLSVDLIKHEVRRGDEKIDLQPREYSLLVYLMQNAGRVVSKTMIMEHVWDYNFDPQTNVVESRLCHLRDKIEKGNRGSLIHTVRGAGYVLSVDA